LEPDRTDTNIRTYNIDNLQKLVNVSFLNNNGYKISKITTLENGKIPTIVNEIAQKNSIQNPAINDIKIAMLNFDTSKFYSTYNRLSKEKSFRDIFYDVFIPLLSERGMLWQTNTINPAHEHFISTLIRQKILVNTELIQAENKLTSNKTFVLFLPDNEIHELGLMFINYELISKGYQSIFLGQSVPTDNLKELINLNVEVVFISYFTIKPEAEELLGYLHEFENKILSQSNAKFWILGKMLDYMNNKKLPKNITAFSSIADLVKVI
jgi:methanogenic corrinoid protein MtbC1